MIFEGEYIEGKKTGKGYSIDKKIEYEIKNSQIYKEKQFNTKGKISLEVEHINKELMKGKQYDGDGNLIFEGEFLSGKRWNGYGKEKNLNYMFEGSYINGKRKGKIKEFDDNDNLKIEINCVEGDMNGKGKRRMMIIH